jgi:hypothetical protein
MKAATTPNIRSTASRGIYDVFRLLVSFQNNAMSQRSLCRSALREPQVCGSNCTCNEQDIYDQRHELPSEMSPDRRIGRNASRVWI